MIQKVLPLLFISITPMINEVTTLGRSLIIGVFSAIILFANPVDVKKHKPVIIVFVIVIIGFLTSWQVNNQNNINFLFGAYGRNLGIISMVGIMILTLCNADFVVKNINKYLNSLQIVLYFIIIYGIVQYLKIDPIPWEKGSGFGSTMGNPNFYSALLGILSIIPFIKFQTAKTVNRFFYVTLYCLAFLLILTSGSFQGMIILILNSFLYILVIKNLNFRKIISKKIVFITGTLISTTLIISIKTSFYESIVNKINNDLQISQRLEHWMFGFRIWNEHKLFGVGIDNVQRFGGEYRNLEMLKWGEVIIPDRSHNFLIDMFATGGVFVGLAWIFFIVLVFKYILDLNKKLVIQSERANFHILALIWIGYLLQAMISPDHLLIMVCGMMSAGAIIGIYSQNAIQSKAK